MRVVGRNRPGVRRVDRRMVGVEPHGLLDPRDSGVGLPGPGQELALLHHHQIVIRVQAESALLVFEADNALIIHDMDPPDVFPYKSATVRRLFAAFQTMIAKAAGV